MNIEAIYDMIGVWINGCGDAKKHCMVRNGKEKKTQQFFFFMTFFTLHSLPRTSIIFSCCDILQFR